METIRTCPRCQQPLSADAPLGLCPSCLLQAAFEPSPDAAASCAEFIDIANPEEVGRLLPQFEILALLGRGGMGVVYKARQLQLDRIVALKILPPLEALSADFVNRFSREAQALAKLNHPHIVHVYEAGESHGLYFIVMEFVDGVNLREIFESRKFAPAEALAMVPKICDALEYAHQKGIVHRDIKPENLLIDQSGQVKIADFGLAKLLHREPLDLSLTRAGIALGTVRYMAPEQMEQPESVDHRADIYSLGVVLYEMLTGEVPRGHFQLPSQKADVDARLDQIVLHALAHDVQRRYQHVSEVGVDVENLSRRKAALPLDHWVAQALTTRLGGWYQARARWTRRIILLALKIVAFGSFIQLMGFSGRFEGVSYKDGIWTPGTATTSFGSPSPWFTEVRAPNHSGLYFHFSSAIWIGLLGMAAALLADQLWRTEPDYDKPANRRERLFWTIAVTVYLAGVIYFFFLWRGLATQGWPVKNDAIHTQR